MIVNAYQRHIRELMTNKYPRERMKTLHNYSIETISRADATPIILHYEWLGSIGKANRFVGLFSPVRELQGVACFGHGPAGDIRKLIGAPAMCLERGACVHWAPPNAASFLINSACKLIYRITGTAIFFAYGDPMAGEYGGVYQAAGWAYIGQGLDGKKGRASRYMVLPRGCDPNNAAEWKTTRELRRAGRRMSFKQARESGWQIAKHPAKHVYAVNVGRYRKQWRRELTCPPYPAPCPELKRKKDQPRTDEPARAKRNQPVFTVPNPVKPQYELFESE